MSGIEIVALCGICLAGGYLAALGKHIKFITRTLHRLDRPKHIEMSAAAMIVVGESRTAFPCHWWLTRRLNRRKVMM